MNIGFHNGAVDAQRVAILQIRLDGGGNDQVIDSFKQYRRQPVERAVEGVVLRHPLAVELREVAQRVAVGDPLGATRR